jgi:serine/threonine protein kinase
MATEHHHRGGDLRTIQTEYVKKFPRFQATIEAILNPGSPEIEQGSQLGDFCIECKIGAGGMGVVYEARDMKLGRKVALKVLPGVFANNPERLELFEREAKVLASLNHPNIATLYGFEEEIGIRFFVLELVPGKTLSEMIRHRPLPVENVKTVFGQIAAALEAAHAHGIIHRDLKPANIKVTPDGKVKVLDFGLATSLNFPGSSQDSGAGESEPNATVSAIAGTVPYMSPEKARGRPVDKRTDVWAFGCCMYEALTGRQAFAGRNATDILAARKSTVGFIRDQPCWN